MKFKRMIRIISLQALLVSVLAVTACGKTSNTKIEKIEDTQWDVTVNKVILNIDGDGQYTVADTAQINKELKKMPHSENITIGWTIPSADGSIWLVAYENEPILTEKVTVTEVNFIPSYGGDIQVAFKFADAKKWEAITQDNIGKRLAVFVNGQLMNAPQVNSEITSGNCAVAIPADMIHDYLPNLDLEKLK